LGRCRLGDKFARRYLGQLEKQRFGKSDMQMSEELNPGLSKSESSETVIKKQLAKAQKDK
jgi:hypothetical protein